MADTGKKGKKKKGKGKTLNLTEFLASDGNTPTFLPVKKLDWADESEDIGDDEVYNPRSQIDMSKLPRGPRASRGADIDLSKLPKGPPFTAFLGNLPYEVSESEIKNFFNGLEIVNIRLIQEGGRQKGFGYAEFVDLATLTQALALNNEPMGSRKLRVDVAGNTGHGPSDQPKREESREEKVSDWRSRADEPPAGGRLNGYSDGDRYGGRGDGGFRDGDRGYRDGGFRQRYDDRGFDRDRGGRDGGFDRGGFDRGGRDGGFDRGGRDGGFDRGGRDGGFDRGRAGRSNFDNSEAGGGDWRRGPEPPSRADNESSWRRGKPAGDMDNSSWGREQPRARPPQDEGRWGGNESQSWRGGGRQDRLEDDLPPEGSERPRERKRLNLQPRTVASDETKKDDGPSSSSIFGGARPVDTAAKEREIEAKLTKKQTTERQPPSEAFSHSESAWSKESARGYIAASDEPEDKSDDGWRGDGVKKDRTRIMRPDLLSEEERSPRDRTVSTGSDKSGDDLDDRPGRVILRKSLSRESKDDEDGVLAPREGRARAGSGGRGRSSGGSTGRGGSKGRGASPGKTTDKKRREKGTDAGKYEEPPPPVFGKQSMFSILADDGEAEGNDSEEENGNS